MTSVPETPGPRRDYERALRRTAERQDMRLVRSARRDPQRREYPTYTLISQSGIGPAVLERVPLQEIEHHLHNVGPASKYAIVPKGERIDAVEGNIVGVQPGAVIDIIPNGKRFQVLQDGELAELPDEGWATIPDDER
ncbi:MAG TPA: hypothetical protein VIJ82_06200 [Streptosporangiaceae bacterium]|jgi:hypothetical protein